MRDQTLNQQNDRPKVSSPASSSPHFCVRRSRKACADERKVCRPHDCHRPFPPRGSARPCRGRLHRRQSNQTALRGASSRCDSCFCPLDGGLHVLDFWRCFTVLCRPRVITVPLPGKPKCLQAQLTEGQRRLDLGGSAMLLRRGSRVAPRYGAFPAEVSKCKKV